LHSSRGSENLERCGRNLRIDSNAGRPMIGFVEKVQGATLISAADEPVCEQQK